MNESMLTGESIPVIKNAVLPNDTILNFEDENIQKKHILFSGTKVI